MQDKRTEVEQGYLMAIEESIHVIFQKLLSVDEIKYIMRRLNQWVEFEIDSRTRK